MTHRSLDGHDPLRSGSVVISWGEELINHHHITLNHVLTLASASASLQHVGAWVPSSGRLGPCRETLPLKARSMAKGMFSLGWLAMRRPTASSLIGKIILLGFCKH